MIMDVFIFFVLVFIAVELAELIDTLHEIRDELRKARS